MARRSNRDALLEAATVCIREKGYARTTARDLVEASGTNLGAIGYHFGSKEQLLNQALYRGFREWLDQVAAALPPAPEAEIWDVVEAAFEQALTGFESHRPLCVAFVEALAQAERSEELRAQMAVGYEAYRRAVTSHLEVLLGSPADSPGAEAATIAALIIALSDGILVQWLLDPERLPSAAEFTHSLRYTLMQSLTGRTA